MKKALLLIVSFMLMLSSCSAPPAPAGIDLYGTYDQNDLYIEEKVLEERNEYDRICIPQLKGLKDTAVQDKINSEIDSLASELIAKHPTINFANFYTRANFANVLSLSFSVGFEEYPYSEHICLNYSLLDGSRLKLEDLFASDANLTDIIRKALYDQMALYGSYDEDTFVHSPNEAEFYKVTKGYLTAEDKSFSFSPAAIYLYPGDNHFGEIKMLDYADDIVIYSKYLTDESIFTGEYQGYKNIFTCADTQYDIFDVIEYGYMEDNLWYDFTVGNTYIPFDDPPEDIRRGKFEALCRKATEDERAKLDTYRTMAKENPDKFYIVLSKPYFNMELDSDYEDGKWHYTYYDTATVSTNIQLFEMPMEIYETVYKDKIIDTYRYDYFAMRGGAYLDTDNLEGATLSEITDTKTYNYMED